ncbi:S66 peptidase family protein [Fluviicola taffensis]|uniref:Peptidase U61 LD-carboxypeptidase A n=1 Tax=Fluviicola taffensis (strain DSM 16823 / NCIMB 13979 / RW262) TaxID=755732 RepID=F2IDL7_FLUTR|nr:LD-carboxypeptidase [Fluviicola taffensis]AEA43390.1 peptidase U61 LD-carboxypeptidase A [Fluviicola taffensis DSM 16823]
MICPPKLVPGDTIALISPAKAIEASHIDFAKAYFEKHGFKVLVGANAKNEYRYFSGTDKERAADMQWAIDHPEVKAIVCNRGGYGAVRLFDEVNWANLLREPKWILGFSDITNFNCLGLKLGIETAHTTMPLNFQENSVESLDSVINILKGEENAYIWNTHPSNKHGMATGNVVGGNCSILYSLLGTPYSPNYENAILFIEDIGEQVYHLDRMLWAFRFAGVFDRIAGLIVGGMTDLKDTATPTQWTVEELVLEHTRFRSFPIAFNAPVGHISDNRAFICGRIATFTATEEQSYFFQ